MTFEHIHTQNIIIQFSTSRSNQFFIRSLIYQSIDVLHEAHLKSSAVNLQTTFKTFHQPMSVQIQTTLSNMSKLIERTQVARFEENVVGAGPVEIFDDGDFYNVLLRNVLT